MIVVDVETHQQYRLYPTEAADLGMNLPISTVERNRARSGIRGRNFRNRNIKK